MDAQRAILRLNGFVILGRRIWVKLAKFRGERKIWKKVKAQNDSSQKEETKPSEMEKQDEEREDSNGCNRARWKIRMRKGKIQMERY